MRVLSAPEVCSHSSSSLAASHLPRGEKAKMVSAASVFQSLAIVQISNKHIARSPILAAEHNRASSGHNYMCRPRAATLLVVVVTGK